MIKTPRTGHCSLEARRQWQTPLFGRNLVAVNVPWVARGGLMAGTRWLSPARDWLALTACSVHRRFTYTHHWTPCLGLQGRDHPPSLPRARWRTQGESGPAAYQPQDLEQITEPSPPRFLGSKTGPHLARLLLGAELINCKGLCQETEGEEKHFPQDHTVEM